MYYNIYFGLIAVELSGPIAQRSEPPAHNRKVPGSNPGGPTITEAMDVKLIWIYQTESDT
jgi:hypothetical protein